RELRGVEVLDDEDTVMRVEDLRDLERPRGVLRRHRAVAPGVAAREGYMALGEPFGHLAPRTGLALGVAVGLLPVRPPSGVEEDGVAGAGLELAEGPLDVGDPDHIARGGAAVADVGQKPAGDDLRNGLGAEVPDPGCPGELGHRPAVVAALADLQMGERV